MIFCLARLFLKNSLNRFLGRASGKVCFSAGICFFSRTEKAPKENLHKEFRRDPGRGVKEGA